jgi:endonuclease I
MKRTPIHNSILPWLFFLVIGFYPSQHSLSQYLKASTSAYVYPEANRNMEAIEKLVDGDCVRLLLDGEQTNGYYLVECKSVNLNGWVYRTKVRRYEGPLPGDEIRIVISSSDNNLIGIAQIPEGYYDGTDNLEGEALKAQLNDIIQDHKEYEYTEDTTDVWDILKETDRDPNNSNNVILIYSGISTRGDLERFGWQREHVWSQSHGQFGRSKGAGVDVHHLRPVNITHNGSSGKSNKDFYDGGVPMLVDGMHYGCYKTDSTWEPRRDVKGDVARMMFYMVVRYEGENDEPDLELINNANTADNFEDEPVYGDLETLLRWHRMDPVDNWERRRNHIIYTKYQRNRNPFIDHPEFAELIFETDDSE